MEEFMNLINGFLIEKALKRYKSLIPIFLYIFIGAKFIRFNERV